MSVDVMEDHTPHKKNISSRSYDDDLDGFNDLGSLDTTPSDNLNSSQMHNASADNNIYASTSMQQSAMQPSQGQQGQQISNQQHNMHYQSTSNSTGQPTILQELLLNNSGSSPRQQSYNANAFPQRVNQNMGRSPMNNSVGNGNNMMPSGMQQRPMHGQQIRQQGPGSNGGNQMYVDGNYQMQQNQQQHGYQTFQPSQQGQMMQRPQNTNFIRSANVQLQQQQQQQPGSQGGMMQGAVINGVNVRKDMQGQHMRSVQMHPNGQVIVGQRMIVHQQNQQGNSVGNQYDAGSPYVNGTGGPVPQGPNSRPQSANDPQQSPVHQQMFGNNVTQGPSPQQNNFVQIQQGGVRSNFQSGGSNISNQLTPNHPQYYTRLNTMEGLHQGQPPPQINTSPNGVQMNGDVRQMNQQQMMNNQPMGIPVQSQRIITQNQISQIHHNGQSNIQPIQQIGVPGPGPLSLALNGPPSAGPLSVCTNVAGGLPPGALGNTNYAQQDPEKRRLIQQQLVLLLHAHKCQQRERSDNGGQNSACNLPHCSTMKSVLDHMTACQNGRMCNYPHCASSRQIIAHWKNCVKDDCPVCKALKCFNNPNSMPGGNFGGSPQSNGSTNIDIYDNNVALGSPEPFRNPPVRTASTGSDTTSNSSLPPQARNPTTAATLGLNYPMTMENIGSMPPPDPPNQSKEWHQSIGQDLRNHLVGKLVKAIFPSPDPAAMQDQRIKDLISYARKVEKEMFEVAGDREEYYHLLAEKIYKIQKELQEKKNRRLELHRGGEIDQRLMSNPIPSAASIKADIQQGISKHLPHSAQPIMELKVEPMEAEIKIQIEPVKPSPVETAAVVVDPPKAIVVNPVVEPVKMEVEEKYPRDEVVFDLETLRVALLPIWLAVDAAEEAIPFRVPVNSELLQIPDYYKVITNPMDLNTMRENIDGWKYTNPQDFCADMWQMFENAWFYNRKNSKVYKQCTRLSEIFTENMDPVMQSLGYCCSHKYNFTHLALFCFGQSMCVIARDQAYYYFETSSSNYGVNVCEKYYYCVKCFENLPESGLNLNENQTDPPNVATKDKFQLMKNNKIDAEPFEVCGICSREWHTICANYNKKVFNEKFICDTCRKAKSISKPENRFTAKKLPHCHLSRHIEDHVNGFISKTLGNSKDKHEVVIRVLCCTDKEVEVKQHMKEKYCTQKFPEKFPYRTKAIFAFEVVDGVEICFFGLHVQEYGSECPAPNTRRVYIAYLDSVRFFQPREIRTDVYHEILLAYLSYVRNLGYIMAHIWACPPSEGDDYIFHCHPPEQKIPKPKRLQDWYKKMLDKGVTESIVVEYKDIHKQAKDDKLATPMELPYFEGDFWPNIIEDCIREVEKEESDRRLTEDLYDDDDDVYTTDDTPRNSAKNAKPRKEKTGKKKAIGKTKGKKNGSIDEVTDKLYTNFERHKEVFFTIRLISVSKEATIKANKIEDPDTLIASDLMDGRDTFLSRARDEHWEFSSLRRARFSTLCLCLALHTSENKDMNYTCNRCQSTANWHCPVCEDFDLCESCKQTNEHDHKLEKINQLIEVDKNTDSCNARNESIQRCIQSLVHACQCRDANCRRSTCHKMKKVVQHTKLCKKRQHTNCPVCKQLIALCCYHAKHCSLPHCSVPFCLNIRQKLQEQKRLQNRRADKMMRRRMEQLHTGQTAVSSQPVQSPSVTGGAKPGSVPSPGSSRPLSASGHGIGKNPAASPSYSSMSTPNNNMSYSPTSGSAPQQQQPSQQHVQMQNHRNMSGQMGQQQGPAQAQQQQQQPQHAQQVSYQGGPMQQQQQQQQQQHQMNPQMRNQFSQKQQFMQQQPQQQQQQQVQQRQMNQQQPQQQIYINQQGHSQQMNMSQQQQHQSQQYNRNQTSSYIIQPQQQQFGQMQQQSQQQQQPQQQQQQTQQVFKSRPMPLIPGSLPQPNMNQYNSRDPDTSRQPDRNQSMSGTNRTIPNDPRIQVIYAKLKAAKTSDERQGLIKDLKKTPHLFTAFWKVFNPSNSSNNGPLF